PLRISSRHKAQRAEGGQIPVVHGLKTKLSKINRSFQSRRSFTHRRIAFGTLQSQPSTISHQLSTARKELSSSELGRTPSHRARPLTGGPTTYCARPPCQTTFCRFSAGGGRRLITPQPHPDIRLSKIQSTRGACAAVVRPDGNGALNTCSCSPWQ